MYPEYYSDLYRRYQTYCRNYGGNRLYKIASGASDYDYRWTEVLMQRAAQQMDGLSLHYYTVTGWSGSKGSATDFSTDDYYWTLGKCREIEDVIKRHIAIMDKYDPQKRVGLIVDEWGTWWDEEPGTISGHLFQQNTLRDAFVASLTLDIFHKYTDRIKMTNIAQIANVLQSMILTKEDKMVLIMCSKCIMYIRMLLFYLSICSVSVRLCVATGLSRWSVRQLHVIRKALFISRCRMLI